MKFRLKKFLFFISLRVGCMISALVLFLFELLAVPLRDARPCCDSFEGVLAVVYRVLGIIYFIGCLMLFVASCVRISFLVMIFLSTSLLHTILFPGFLVAEVMIWHANIIDLGLSIGGLVLRIYFWVVAYAFYYQCKDDGLNEVNLTQSKKLRGSTVSLKGNN